MKHFKQFFVFALLALFSVGQVWSAISTTSTWTATALGSIPDGSTVIIINANGKAISNATVTKAPAKIEATYNSTTKKIAVTTTGKSLDDIAWTTEKSTNGTKFWVYGSTTILLGLSKLNDNNAVAVNTTTNALYNELVMGENGNLLEAMNGTSRGGRFVGEYVSGSDWRSYNSEAANNYKSGSTVPALTFYVLDETPSDKPAVSANPSAAAFGTKNIYEVANQSGSLNISVEGEKLTGNITATLSGTDAAKFSISGAPFSQTAGSASGTLVVSYTVTEAGEYEALVTLSSEGADDVELPISLSAVNIVPTIYNKVTDAAELNAGDKVIFVYEAGSVAAGAMGSNAYLASIDVSAGLNTSANPASLTITDEEVMVFTLGGEAGAWVLTSSEGKLSEKSHSAGSSCDLVKDGETTWSIAISDGNATITGTDNYIQYNTGSPRFRTYKSGQKIIQLYKESDGKEAAGLAYAAADAQKLAKVGGTLTAPTLANPNGVTVTYASNNTTVVDVDASTGAVTINAAGVATITASFAGDEDYKAGSATYTIFVATEAGTAEDPLSEVSAKALIDNGCTLNVHVKGTVDVVGSLNTTYGSISLTLTGGFQFYGMLNTSGAQFAENPFVVGDVVTAVGNLKKHNTTYELDLNCQLVERIPFAGSKTSIANTKETAYSVAQALAYAADAVTYDLDDVVYVRGKVAVASTGLFSDKYLTYSISDDGTNENMLKVYNGLGVNGADFTSIDDIKVGEIVIVKGKLYDFKGTKELTDNELVWKKPVATIAIDNMELEYAEVATISATITPAAAASTVEYSIKAGSDDVITLSGDQITAKSVTGTATIVATIAGTDDYEGATKEFTVSVAEADTRKVANSPATFTTTNGNLDPADIAYTSYQGGSSTAPAIYNDGIRLYQIGGSNDFGGFVTITAKTGCTIDEVQITTTSKYATTVAYSVDGNENLLKSESVAASSSYTTGTGLNVSSVNILNVGTGSSGRLEIASIKVYYTGEPATIDHYELGGTYQTAFMQDEEFNHTGLIVYAVYDALGENKVDITSMCTFSEPDMNTTGEKTIEITYNEAVVTSYTINVAADSRKVANSPATFTTVSGDMTPNDITFASYQGGAGTAPANYNDGIRLYQAPSADAIGGFITLKAKKGCTIDQVKITTTSTYATTVAYSVDGNENLLGSESVAKSSDYSTPSGLNVESVNIVNKGTGSSGRLEIASIKVWYTGSPLAIDHYFLGGTYETTFEQNGTFDYTGLKVYASYDADETITEEITGFVVEADLTTAGAAEAIVKLNDVELIRYDITVTAGKEDPALAYTPESATITAGDTWTAPTLSNTFNVTPITYSSDKESVATVDENGVITLAGGYGTAVITAHFDETAAYIESEATYTITVNKPAATPTSTVYRKVTATADITDGEYLIVYEGDATHDAAVFDGSLDNVDQALKALPVAIVSDEIAGNTDLDAATFTIDVTSGTLQSASGWYIGRTANSNGLDKSESEAYVNTFAITDGAAVITSSAGPTLRYNYASDQLRFRYYKSGQQAIQLYKKVTPTKEVIRDGLSAGKWGTICPKQTVENVEGATFYQITYLEEQNNLPYNVVFDQIEGTTLTAGKPYFFIAEGEKIRGIKTGDAVTSGSNVNGFYGYISSTEPAESMELTTWHADYTPGEDNTFVIHNNSVFRINQSGTMLKSERCYININATEPTREPSSASPVRRRIVMGVQNTNAATGMDELNTSEAPRKMIIDGKMYIFRGEKMYNANGQLVK